ncbi:MAG: effector-associated domain EAD1-containing protein [Anaerolineae bacterium]|jgi:hypothetical protein|nr:effector-associated domain EAD1-containing protein [Anaerolineae bacterium]
MTVALTSAQRRQLFEAVVGAYPSKASLAQAVYYEFGTNPNVISSGESLQAFAQDIVSWAEVNGRTEELVKAVRRANPSNEPLLKFEKALYSGVRAQSPSRSVQPRPAQSAPPTPKLPARLRNTLIEALLRVPGMDNFQMRNAILIGIPFPSGLTREPGDAGKDLSIIIDQLSSLSQLRSGTWPLLILVDNARAYAEGADAKTQLDKVYQQLLKMYGVEDRPASAQKDLPW